MFGVLSQAAPKVCAIQTKAGTVRRDGRRGGAVQVIKVKYSSVDGRGGKWRSFKTLGRARVFAQYWVGKNPEIGSTYAVSNDGIGKIEVMGATSSTPSTAISTAALRPKLKSRPHARRTLKARAAPMTSSRTRRPPMTSFHLS
jgi:hypothetical protein